VFVKRNELVCPGEILKLKSTGSSIKKDFRVVKKPETARQFKRLEANKMWFVQLAFER
jgi:hypothetical protein